MIKRILAFFEETQVEPESLTVDECAAVLLIEIMLADHDLDEKEKTCISDILSRRMGATTTEIEACIDVALKRHEDSNDLHQFVRIINEHYGEEERYGLLLDLWRVAYADGRLDKYEDHRIRRVAELMHLHHSHFIQAKNAAKPSES